MLKLNKITRKHVYDMEIAEFSVSSNICRIEEDLRFRTTSLKGGIVLF